MTATSVPPVPAIRRPLGVWVFSILYWISAPLGLASALLDLIFLSGQEVLTPLMLGSGLVRIGYLLTVLAVSFGVWRGLNLYRIVLLWIVGINALVTIAISLYIGSVSPEVERSTTAASVLGAAAFWLIHMWYFRRSSTVVFYR